MPYHIYAYIYKTHTNACTHTLMWACIYILKILFPFILLFLVAMTEFFLVLVLGKRAELKSWNQSGLNWILKCPCHVEMWNDWPSGFCSPWVMDVLFGGGGRVEREREGEFLQNLWSLWSPFMKSILLPNIPKYTYVDTLVIIILKLFTYFLFLKSEPEYFYIVFKIFSSLSKII